MSKQVERDYDMHDPTMLIEGTRFLDQFIENKTDFTDSYTGLIDPFAADMQDDIDICKATESDASYLTYQHLKTVDVNNKIKIGQRNNQKVFSYVKQAFPENEGVYMTFGQHLYDKQRNSHSDFPNLLLKAYDMANTPATKALLIAKGATEAMILQLKTDGEAIALAVRVQQKFIESRHLSTQERIINLNKVWARMVLISECAKEIYIDNYAMLQTFLLYPDNPPVPPPPDPPVDTTPTV